MTAGDGRAALAAVGESKLRLIVLDIVNSGSLSQYTIDSNGTVVLGKSPDAIGIPCAVDSAASSDGHFLYAQSGGSSSVKAFAVNADGSLSPVGSWTIPNGRSQEGSAAA